MAENSKIEWTHHTFNPWVGCQRVSPGCEHCYAEALDKRVGGALVGGVKQLRWGPKAPRVRTSPQNWKLPLKWNRKALEAGERHRVFCASLADVFEDRAELVPWRAELFHLIALTPQLDWLLLTKRPENIARLWPDEAQTLGGPHAFNIWLGTTVEDQRRADDRLDHLLAVPAAVHFVSAEPLLEPVDLRRWLKPRLASPMINAPPSLGGPRYDYATVKWVIVGGESGGKARRFEAEWARAIVKQCSATGASAFVKQMGANVIDRNDAGFNGDDDEGWHSAVEYGGHIRVEHDLDGHRDDYQGAPVRVRLRDHHGGDMDEWPADLRVRQFPEVRR